MAKAKKTIAKSKHRSSEPSPVLAIGDILNPHLQ